MKLFILACAIAFSLGATAQTQQSAFTVQGNCGMCKSKIEAAAKSAGATYAVWSPETDSLAITYNAKKTDPAKIKKAIAAAGYDTDAHRATDAAYDALHACCKYDRTPAKAACCAGAAAATFEKEKKGGIK